MRIPSLRGEKTKAQRSEILYLRSHSWEVGLQHLSPGTQDRVPDLGVILA